MATLAVILHYLFLTYLILILVRIFGSWIPAFANSRLMQFVAFYTDPYLNIFRRILPPIGGTLDISPILAIFALKILEYIILGIIL